MTLNVTTKALVALNPDTGNLDLLQVNDDVDVLNAMHIEFRNFVSLAISNPDLPHEVYERSMNVLRSVKIVDVRVAEVELI